MTKLVLTPVDTFFFKNHHATQAGEATVMESIFLRARIRFTARCGRRTFMRTARLTTLRRAVMNR
ncbi:hypothetical protein LR69_03421 [Geobacillus sp. BCO2]|nr:hypothetical protein LR69_03421 [Geobacillus sp. BCO2]